MRQKKSRSTQRKTGALSIAKKRGRRKKRRKEGGPIGEGGDGKE